MLLFATTYELSLRPIQSTTRWVKYNSRCPSACHTGIFESGGTVPRILGLQHQTQISFNSGCFMPGKQLPVPTHSTGTQAGHRACQDGLEEIMTSCPLSQIEPQFLGQPVLTVTNAISQLPYTTSTGRYRGLGVRLKVHSLLVSMCNYISAARTSL